MEMNKYIILTAEGCTIAPNENYEVENLQVLGIVEKVKNENEAITKLLKENKWINDAGFDIEKFITYQIL